jgi:hypothetical protein
MIETNQTIADQAGALCTHQRVENTQDVIKAGQILSDSFLPNSASHLICTRQRVDNTQDVMKAGQTLSDSFLTRPLTFSASISVLGAYKMSPKSSLNGPNACRTKNLGHPLPDVSATLLP